MNNQLVEQQNITTNPPVWQHPVLPGNCPGPNHVLGTKRGFVESPQSADDFQWLPIENLQIGGTSVESVNGKTGVVVLDGNDINVDNAANTPETIKAAVTRIDNAIQGKANQTDFAQEIADRAAADLELEDKIDEKSKVTVDAQSKAGAQTIQSINVDGTDYNLPQGGGTGAVDSVNGKTGTVVLDGKDINIDGTATTPETIKAGFQRVEDDIDSLDSTKADADDVYAKSETYNKTEADALINSKSVVSGVYEGTKWTKLTVDGVQKNIPDTGSIVSGTNDGTNWQTITIDGVQKSIPSGGSVEVPVISLNGTEGTLSTEDYNKLNNILTVLFVQGSTYLHRNAGEFNDYLSYSGVMSEDYEFARAVVTIGTNKRWQLRLYPSEKDLLECYSKIISQLPTSGNPVTFSDIANNLKSLMDESYSIEGYESDNTNGQRVMKIYCNNTYLYFRLVSHDSSTGLHIYIYDDGTNKYKASFTGASTGNITVTIEKV